MIDNLPAIYNQTSEDGDSYEIDVGFPLGFEDDVTGDIYLNNHVRLFINYTENIRLE